MEEKMKNRENPVEVLRNMAVGSEETFPAPQYNSIKNMATSYGFQWGRKYTTHIDRTLRVVKIVRIQ